MKIYKNKDEVESLRFILSRGSNSQEQKGGMLNVVAKFSSLQQVEL